MTLRRGLPGAGVFSRHCFPWIRLDWDPSWHPRELLAPPGKAGFSSPLGAAGGHGASGFPPSPHDQEGRVLGACALGTVPSPKQDLFPSEARTHGAPQAVTPVLRGGSVLCLSFLVARSKVGEKAPV